MLIKDSRKPALCLRPFIQATLQFCTRPLRSIPFSSSLQMKPPISQDLYRDPPHSTHAIHTQTNTLLLLIATRQHPLLPHNLPLIRLYILGRINILPSITHRRRIRHMATTCSPTLRCIMLHTRLLSNRTQCLTATRGRPVGGIHPILFPFRRNSKVVLPHILLTHFCFDPLSSPIHQAHRHPAASLCPLFVP